MLTRRTVFAAAALTSAAWLGAAGSAGAQTPAAPAAPAASDFDKLVAGAKAIEGLIRVHLKDDHLYAEIPPGLLDRPMIWPMAVSRGIGAGEILGGMTLNFDDDWVVTFRRVGDKIHVVRKNVRFRAKAGTPTAHAVERAYTDSVIAGLKILTTNPARGTSVVDFADLFLTDMPGISQALRGYFMDRSLSTFHQVKGFPENVEIQVAAVFRSQGQLPIQTVADPRSATVHLHYSLSMLPADGYRPRTADDRVGYFLTAIKDFTRDAGDSSFVRYLNRWKLEKVDPSAAMSEAKKPIRFWIERSVPFEYRRYVREGVLEWNKAFEKIGFVNAVEVRQQDDKDDFDPEDIRFNTIRWITSDAGFAMGPSRVNPYTGEILDADIIFDASMVRFEREEYQILSSDPAKLLEYDFRGDKADRAHDPTHRNCSCRLAHGHKREMMIGLAALEARGMWKPGEPVPLEFIGQSIKHTVMHEVGHTLGLRHNFKASSIYSLDDINDPKNKDRASSGSVMDYVPVNVSPKGKPQGPFFPQTIGPYDYWAIEFAYVEDEGKAKEIASRGAKPELAYATDEDTHRVDSDSLANAWDLGDDALKYGAGRVALLKELLVGLPDRVTAGGEGWQPTRRALSMLLNAHAMTANHAAKLVGGVTLHRDHKGDPGARMPVAAVSADRQRQAMKYLRENVFNDSGLSFPPELVSRLAPARWYHWGSNAMFGDLTFPLHAQVLMSQRMALYQMFSGANLRRMQEAELTLKPDADSFGIAELFRGVTEAVWADSLGDPPDRPFTDRKPMVGGFRRALQREHVELLGRLSLPGGFGYPADARSLARLQLRKILATIDIELPGKLKAAARKNKEIDDLSDAHLQDVRERIKKLLDASVVLAN